MQQVATTAATTTTNTPPAAAACAAAAAYDSSIAGDSAISPKSPAGREACSAMLRLSPKAPAQDLWSQRVVDRAQRV